MNKQLSPHETRTRGRYYRPAPASASKVVASTATADKSIKASSAALLAALQKRYPKYVDI